MIQLANDPNASRMSYHPGQNDAKGSNFSAQRGRSGHAWPFLSKHTDRPTQLDSQKPVSGDSGS